jgi:hypothetical protein
VRVLAGVRGACVKIIFLLICVYAFGVVFVSGEVLFADFSETDLEGDMSWGQFMDNCDEGGTPYSSGGFFDSIDVHLVIDTDKETITGSLSGRGSSDSQYTHLYTQEYSFEGSISGSAKRVYWGGHLWNWEFEADVELDLSFSTSYRCNTPTDGEYNWISREETVHVTKLLTMSTASDDNKQFMNFGISWKNYDDQFSTPISFYLTHKNENDQRRAILPLEMPDPIDLSIEVGGPEYVGKGSNGEVFDLEVSGEQRGMVKKVYWYFRNWDESFGEYRWFETFEQTNLDELVIDSGKIAEWMNRVDQFGETSNNGKSLRMQVSVEFERDEYEWLLLTKGYNFTVTSGEVVEESRYKITGLNQPMKFIQVEIESNKGSHETFADEDGYFVIPPNLADSSEMDLSIKFAYQNKEKEYFRIYSGKVDEPEPLVLILLIKDGKIESAELDNHVGFNTITFKMSPAKLDDIVLDTYLLERGLHTYISIYHHITEALEFYTEHLGEDLTYKLPIGIYPFYEEGDRIAYLFNEAQVGIVFHVSESDHDSPNRPVNREYHEFSHYVMHSLYGFVPGASTLADSTNHDGYLNVDTGDSYSEGFAHFMSVIINEYYSEKSGIPYVPDQCGVMGSLEDNMMPWEKRGKGEEWAIAGVLWDLYDTDSHITKAVESKEVITGEMFDKMLIEADLNDNGKLDEFELAYHRMNPNWNRHSIFQQSYLENDKNGDELFDKEELESILRYEEEDLESYLNKADKNKNGVVDYDEALSYIGAQEFERFSKKISERDREWIANELKKSGSQTELDRIGFIQFSKTKQKVDETVIIPLNEIWSILRTPKKNFYEVYQAFIEKYPHLKMEIDKIFQAHGFWQDKNPGNGKLDENEPYRDTNKNGEYDEGEPFVDYPINGFKYDLGEVIGPAANYDRQERRSTVELPGQRVKVGNSVPFYRVTVVYYSDGINSSLVPLRIVEYEVENKDGFIYVPFPPEAYDAIISIEPVDVDFTRELKVSSIEFHHNYTDYVEKGYYVEHDFNIIGEIPDPPVNPYFVDFSREEQPPTDTETEPSPSPTQSPEPELSPSPSPKPESPGGIPGFPIEAIFMGMLLGVLLIWYSRR